MILAITVERYLVICHRKRKLLSPFRNILSVFLFSLFVSIPKFFEFVHFQEKNSNEKITTNMTNNGSNAIASTGHLIVSSNISEPYAYRISRIGENPEFLMFNAYHEVLVISFCLVTIFYCNYQICCNIRISGSIKNR